MRAAALLGAFCLPVSTACTEPEAQPLTPDELERVLGLSPGPRPPSPGNRFAEDPDAAALGRRLFFDEGLSASGRISCASCHDPRRHFTDGRPRSAGLAEVSRNAPTLLGAAGYPFLGWDGAKDSVWAQALAPLESPAEHGLGRTDVARRVAEAHRAPYEVVFGPLPEGLEGSRFPRGARPVPGDPGHPAEKAWRAMAPPDRALVDRIFVQVGKSLEAYVRTLEAEPSPFDRYVAALASGDLSGGGHLDPAALRGLRAFVSEEVGCVHCHHGPMLTDREFHNLGVPGAFGAPAADPGRRRGLALVAADPLRCGSPESDAERCPDLAFLPPAGEAHEGAFRTPSLRHVAETGPYMHAGQLGSLEEVIAFYRTLPGAPDVGRRDPMLRPFARRVATSDLVAFLRALGGPLRGETSIEATSARAR